MNFIRKTLILFTACFPFLGFASFPDAPYVATPKPWFTGPLLTPSGSVVPNGHCNIQSYLFFTNTYGHYNAHWEKKSMPHLFIGSFILDAQFGLSKICDFQFSPIVLYKHRKHVHTWAFGDIPISLGFQLLEGTSTRPAVKFRLLANLPTGKYQHLDPTKEGLDAGGLGSYLPGISLTTGYTFRMGCSQFLATRLNLSYRFPNPVHVKGLNTYGGSAQTKGKVFPGNFFISSLGLEWSFTQHWVLACDLEYAHFNKTRFKGKKGHLNGIPHLIDPLSKEQVSIAPAIEYNFTKNVGIIAGCWVTIAGRNTPAFASGVLSLNIYK